MTPSIVENSDATMRGHPVNVSSLNDAGSPEAEDEQDRDGRVEPVLVQRGQSQLPLVASPSAKSQVNELK